VIGSAAPFTVTSGQIMSVKLPCANTAASGRTVVRAVVTQTFATGSFAAAPCELATSFETDDSTTGVTHVLRHRSAGRVFFRSAARVPAG